MLTTETTSLGQRIAAARTKQRMSQAELATATGIHIGTLRKLEQGQRQSARLETITTIAGSLGVPVSDLLGVQPGRTEQGQADIAALRAAIYQRTTNTDPPGIEQIRNNVAAMRHLYWHGRYGQLAAEVPVRLAEARAAVRAAASDQQRADAHAMLAAVLQVTASLVTQLSFEDLAHVALLQATDSAAASGDPLLMASQQSAMAWVLSRQGLWQEAHQLTHEAAASIEPVLSRAPAAQIGVWGELLHFGLVALSRTGRSPEAHELLRLVQAAGEAVGDRTDARAYGVAFDLTWSGHSRVQLALMDDDPRAALAAAARVADPSKLPPSVHARYLLNVAWAAALDWRSSEALAALRQIETVAPDLLDHHGLARAVVEELMPRRRRQRLPGLLSLAERMGVIE